MIMDGPLFDIIGKINQRAAQHNYLIVSFLIFFTQVPPALTTETTDSLRVGGVMVVFFIPAGVGSDLAVTSSIWAFLAVSPNDSFKSERFFTSLCP